MTNATTKSLQIINQKPINATHSSRTDYQQKLGTSGATATKNGRNFVVTATPCFGDSRANWYQGGFLIGPAHYRNYGNYTDVGLIKVSNYNRGITNKVYKSEAYDTGYNSYSYIPFGQYVCKAGNTTGYTCG